jgi:hypothetical protein
VFGAAAGLMVGLFIGFAGGFVVGQRGEPLPVPRSAAQAPVPAQPAQATAPQNYTESPVSESGARSSPAPRSDDAPATSQSEAIVEERIPARVPQARVRTRVPAAQAPASSRAPVAQALSPLDVARGDPEALEGSGLRTGSLEVVSRPSGAEIYVDDVRVGTTPLTMSRVREGSHRVRLDLPGHRRWATSVDVKSGARARVGASLER